MDHRHPMLSNSSIARYPSIRTRTLRSSRMTRWSAAGLPWLAAMFFCICTEVGIVASFAPDAANFTDLELDETNARTSVGDVSALNDILRNFGGENILPGNWTGDPCVPSSSQWSWVGCSATKPARITGLFLSEEDLQRSVLPASIANLTELVNLNMSHCNLTGTLPDLSPLSKLRVLYLFNNSLSGSLPDALFNLTSLIMMDFSHNKLSGSISSTLLRLKNLQFLYLDDNNFTGELPDIGQLQQLEEIKFSFNRFQGPIPKDVTQLKKLRWMWFDNNPGLVGPLPNVTEFPYLERVYVFNSSFNGSLPNFSNMVNLYEILLNNNRFSGYLPNLVNLPSLFALAVDRNDLSGPIPASLATFKRLRILDLAHNSFSSIPEKLLEKYDNYTLRGYHFPRYDAYLRHHVTGVPSKHLDTWIIFLLVLLIVLGSIVTISFTILCKRNFYIISSKLRSSRSRASTATPSGPFSGLEVTQLERLQLGPCKFSYNQLKMTTKGFSSKEILGKGGFGVVYKGVLEEVGHVAIKRISKTAKQGAREFIAEIKIIGQLRHRNLVQLLGWCYEEKDLLLVYDFMPNGSLDKKLFLDKNSPPALSWEQRFNILCGVARALVFLHEEWEHRVIHRDVKASNVLLDIDFNARLGDFGLARLYEHSNSSPDSTFMAGTWGYLAPECTPMFRGKVTDKTDVYSFGVLVLEIACGRKVMDHNVPTMEFMLQDWVWALYYHGRIADSVDPRFLAHGVKYDDTQVNIALRVGLLCSHPDPAARPNMRQTLQILKGEASLPTLPRVKPAPYFVLQTESASPEGSKVLEGFGNSRCSDERSVLKASQVEVEKGKLSGMMTWCGPLQEGDHAGNVTFSSLPDLEA